MDQVTSTTNTSKIIPEIWSRRYYDVLLDDLPFNSIVNRDYEGEINELGDRVNISSVPEFDEAGILAEDAAGQAEAVVIQGQQLVINKRVYKDFIVTRRSRLQSLPFVDELREKAVFALMKRMQAIIIEDTVPAAGTHQLSWDSGTTLDLTDIVESKTRLDLSNVPGSDRHMVLGSNQTNDIFSITGFTSSDFLLAGAPLQSGEVPTSLLGFMPHSTNVVGDVGYFFHRSYMTLASQEGVNIEEHNLGVDGKRATRINVDSLFGLKQLDDERVVTKS